MEDVLGKRLADHKLRSTEIRRQVLGAFLQSGNHALGKLEFESKLPDLDRITLYRTLRSFEEKGLIHQALDGSGKPKYALCAEQCNHHGHQHDHAHFRCDGCAKTICLPGNLNEAPRLPEGFRMTKYYLVIEGLCDGCAETL